MKNKSLMFGFLMSFCLQTYAKDEANCGELRARARSGDILFIDINNFLYKRVARVSGGWTSHVGLVFQEPNGKWYVYESTIPVAKKTELCKFVEKSHQGHWALARLKTQITDQETERLRSAAASRFGKFYDTGFNWDSNKQYCSKFVREVYWDVLGVEVGHIETFRKLFDAYEESPQKKKDLAFWTAWFFGKIPWKQRVVTPESQLRDPKLFVVYENLQN